MIKELSESLRHVGHYFAICFLRIVVGVFVLDSALEKIYGSYLSEPRLAGSINQWASVNNIPLFVENIFTQHIIGYWSMVSYFQVSFEFIAGLLLLIGFCVRPVSIALILYYWFFSFIEPEASWPFINLFLFTLMAICWAGAGRCLGVDYFFYKRRRGFLW